ncbi:MAG: tripartite tricarboxylate transporter permease [Chloroflexi bacterium]|nr:tripartite tricarboxylate transporter permease [Chloroflexota bacterium]
MTGRRGDRGSLRHAYRNGLLYPAAAIGSFYLLHLVGWAFWGQLGFAEFAAIMLASIFLPAVLAPRAIVRGLASAALGVLFGTVGIHSITGELRFVFDQPWLWTGLPAPQVLIGLFAIPWGIGLVRCGLIGAGVHATPAVVAVAVAGGFGAALALGQSLRSNTGYPTIGYYLFEVGGVWGDLLWLMSLAGSFLILWGLSLLLLRHPGAEQHSYVRQASISGLGGVVIALLLGIGVIQTTSWMNVPVMAAFSMMGLLLHAFGWPRLPLFAGIIVGPIAEESYLSATNVVSNQVEVFTRPIGLTLAIVILAVAVGSHRLANAGSPAVAGEPTAPKPTAAALQWRNAVPLLGIAAGISFYWGSMGFSSEYTWLFVRLSAVAVIALCVLQLFLNIRDAKRPSPYAADTDTRAEREIVSVVTYLVFTFLGVVVFALTTALLAVLFHQRDSDGRGRNAVSHALSRLTLPKVREATLPLGIGVAALILLTAVLGIQWGLAALAGTLPFLLLRNVRTSPAAAAVGVALAGAALVALVRWSSDVPAVYLHITASETRLPIGLSSVMETLGPVVGPVRYALEIGYLSLTTIMQGFVALFGALFFLHAAGVALISIALVLSVVRPSGSALNSPLLRVLVSWQTLGSLVVMVLTLEAVHTIVS